MAGDPYGLMVQDGMMKYLGRIRFGCLHEDKIDKELGPAMLVDDAAHYPLASCISVVFQSVK